MDLFVFFIPKIKKSFIWLFIGFQILTLSSCKNEDGVNNEVKITPEFIEAIKQYDELYTFSNGLAPVKKDGKFGFIDTKGNLIIPCKYDNVGPYSENKIVALDKDFKITIVSLDGTEIVTDYTYDPLYWGFHYFGDSDYRDIVCFSNGELEVPVYMSDQPFYLNYEGQIIEHLVDNDNQEIKTNSKLSTGNNDEPQIIEITSTDIYGNEIKLYGLKDNQGSIILPAEYNYISRFSNGVAQISKFVQSADWKPYGLYQPDGMTIFAYVDKTGHTTFVEDDFKKLEVYRAAQISKKQEKEKEEERIKKEGPDWLQGKWKVELKDDYGNFLGYLYSTFNHGNLKVEMGEMVFEYTYTLSDDLSEILFANGKYYLQDERVISANGETMTKVSNSTSSDSSSGSISNQSQSYQNNKEFEIMNKLKELGDKGRAMMPRIEQLYRSQQAYGIGGNPEAHFSLREALDQLLKIKNEQIRLAEQLGDAQLVREYKDQRAQVQESADLMLYGRSGRVQTPY